MDRVEERKGVGFGQSQNVEGEESSLTGSFPFRTPWLPQRNVVFLDSHKNVNRVDRVRDQLDAVCVSSGRKETSGPTTLLF